MNNLFSTHAARSIWNFCWKFYRYGGMLQHQTRFSLYVDCSEKVFDILCVPRVNSNYNSVVFGF